MSPTPAIPKLAVAEGVIHDLAVERTHLAGRAEVALVDVSTPDGVALATRGFDALVVNMHPMPRLHLEALAPTVSVVVRAGTGLDAIELDAARDLGLVVYHTPDYCVEEVASHAVAWILALARRLVPANRVARTSFAQWRRVGVVRPLSHLRVGLLGGGRIGTRTAAMLQPLVASVTIFDPYSSGETDGFARAATLNDLLESSDVLSLHCPLTPETRRIISAAELARMPHGAMLVNCSRGGLIDEDALLAALESGDLGGAALDVFEQEPLAAGSRLAQSDLVCLSPHIGWYSTASEIRVRTQAIDGAMAILGGRQPATGRIAVPQPRLRGRSA